jgi:cytochrome P450
VASEDRAAADRAVVWLRQYVSQLLEERLREDRDDVLSRLARAHESTDVSAADVVDNVAFLLFAGFETTAHQIGNAVAALLTNPDELARLRGQPGLLPRCVEEALRYDPPIQGVARVVREPIVLGDHSVKPGRVVVLLLGSANRDEQRFEDPDGFHADRAPNPHVSFGGGGHYCLGALLARLELTAALDGFLRRTAAIDLAAAPVREHGTRFRCYASTPVAVRPA